MRTIGILGFGHIGSLLARSLIAGGRIPPERICILDRHPEKTEPLIREHPSLSIVSDIRTWEDRSDWLFACVNPLGLPSLCRELGNPLPSGKMFISSAASPPLGSLETMLGGKVARIYPSITQSTGHGVCLVAFGERVGAEERDELLQLLSPLGGVFEIPEEDFRLYGDITSCGPGWMAFLGGALSQAAVDRGADAALAEAMARETMLGTALLLTERCLAFGELVRQVAKPGGTTEAGIRVLAESLPTLMKEVLEAAGERRKTVALGVEERRQG